MRFARLDQAVSFCRLCSISTESNDELVVRMDQMLQSNCILEEVSKTTDKVFFTVVYTTGKRKGVVALSAATKQHLLSSSI